VRSHDGQGEPRSLTEGSAVWRYPASWSPDSRSLAFGDSASRLNVLNVESGALEVADTGLQGDINVYHWSPDSRWIAYETTHPETELPSLAVYSLDSKSPTILGDGLSFDFEPVFSADGDYLFFLSNRDYNLNFSDFEFNYIYDNATRIFVAALHGDVASLFPLQSDEVEIDSGGDEDGDDEGDDEGDGEGDEGSSVAVTAEGFVDRTLALPGLSSGNYADLAAVEGALIYRSIPDDGDPALMRFDLEEREAKEISSGVRAYVLAARGEKVLMRKGGGWSITDAKPGSDGEAVDLSGARMKLEPRLEWRQMFDEGWRIGRDWFYDENMHGVDWDLMKERYGALVPHVAHRSDLDFIFGELAGELEAGHAYVQRGSERSIDRVEGGMLGAELEADDSGRYRISKIFGGENWDDTYRSPLTEPGIDASAGDFLLAIDGVDLTTSDHPFRLLEGKGDQQVKLTLSATGDASDAREVTVQTITDERPLRYLDWITTRAALVEELSDGRVGYMHLPDTAIDGNRALQKFFYSQVTKPALIVDDRFNGGGFIPDRMIEMLSRTTLSYWSRRGIQAFTTPGFRHDGPKAMLINGYAASGGDALPYYFRKKGLGPLVGTTTWGGLIGISGNPMLADGGGILYPTFRFYDAEGEWAVENVGVAPDVEVWDLPEAIAAGGDPSIEKAVELLLQELEGFEGDPVTPTPPDMGGN
jgi:tricorn protease